MRGGRQHACCLPPLIFCTFVFFYVSYPMPLRQGLVSELHRNSAYLCRRAALASSLDTSGLTDKQPVLIQSCRMSNVRKVTFLAPPTSPTRLQSITCNN